MLYNDDVLWLKIINFFLYLVDLSNHQASPYSNKNESKDFISLIEDNESSSKPNKSLR